MRDRRAVRGSTHALNEDARRSSARHSSRLGMGLPGLKTGSASRTVPAIGWAAVEWTVEWTGEWAGEWAVAA